jgi:hypothetical protein
MKTIEQWRLTLKWSMRLTIGFFAIYAGIVCIRLPFVWSRVPPELRGDFAQMAIVAPFLFSFLFFCFCLFLVRLLLLIMSWRNRSKCAEPSTGANAG